MFKQCVTMLLGATAVCVAPAAQIEWMTDLEAAGKKARKEGKMLLVEFTGSDWCKACIVQKKNVLDKPEFIDWVNRNYVPVEVNIPNDSSLVGGDAQLANNKKICEDYGISIFPSLMIMSPDLVILGGYQGSMPTPAAAMAALNNCRNSVAEYEKAMELKGVERAKALYAIYQRKSEEERALAYPLLRLIARADKENVTGVQAIYKPLHQKKTFERKFAAAKNFEEQLQIVDSYIAKALPENKSAFLRCKESILRLQVMKIMKNPSSVEEIIYARDLALQAADCMENPAEREKFIKHIKDYYSDPEALYRKAKENKK